MNAMLRNLVSPLVRPTLGFALTAVLFIYAVVFLAAAVVKPNFRPLIFLPFIPLFWVSLRVLIKAGKPPGTLVGTILFTLMLLNFVISFLGVLLLAVSVASQL